MRKTAHTLLLLAVLCLLVPSVLAPQSNGERVSLTIDPSEVKIGTFYHGTSVNVKAETPPCDGVVIKIESEGKELVLNRKARLGFIWMNVAKVTVEHAPEVYLLASSDDVAAICSREVRNKLRVGTETLKERVTFSSEKPLTGGEFGEFLKLKRHSGTYKEDIPITLEPAGGGRQTVTAAIPLPSVVPSGKYALRLYCFVEGQLVEETSAILTIVMSGLPRIESNLAHERAAAYGVAAILVAMIAGITMGVIFSSKSGGGH